MKNKMKFVPISNDKNIIDMLTPPIEAYKVVPNWYKDLAGYHGGTSNDIRYLFPINDRGSDGSDVSTKLCMPFMDALMSGYMYLLEDDLNIEINENEKPELSWQKQMPLVDIRPMVDMAIPKDCHPIQFGFKMNWYYETPKDYSVLITHPFNRYDLPFYVPSGIVDSDIWGLPVFIPFFLKKNFNGKILQKTPIFQMIPIKRDPWELDIDYSKESYEKHIILEEKRRSHVTGHYKKSTWQKKIF
jgi:hypothetical protein